MLPFKGLFHISSYMEIIKRLSCGELNCIVDCVVVNGMYWFRGKDVATALGYADTKRALQLHVEGEDKCKLEELRGEQINHQPVSNFFY